MPSSLFLPIVAQKSAELKHKRSKQKITVASVEQNKSSALYKELKSRSKRCLELERVCSKFKTRQDLMVSYYLSLPVHPPIIIVAFSQ